MRRLPLHVKEPARVSSSPEQIDERHQGNLGGISPDTRPIEHRLARKEAADAYTVKAACQLIVVRPGFDRVHDPAPVQLRIDPADVGGDPSAGASTVGATIKHGAERRVDADLIVLEGFAQRATNPQTVQGKDGPIQWRVPAHQARPGWHWKDTGLVRGESEVLVERPRHSDEVVMSPLLRRSEWRLHVGILPPGQSVWLVAGPRGCPGVTDMQLAQPATYSGDRVLPSGQLNASGAVDPTQSVLEA
jgi:hypothetical protein